MTHPDETISGEFVAKMNALAQTMDELFNGNAKGKDRKVAFVVLVAPFDDGEREGRVNYISNGNRKDVVTLMKETIARFEGQAEPKVGRA